MFPITALCLSANFCSPSEAVIESLPFLFFPDVLGYATIAQSSRQFSSRFSNNPDDAAFDTYVCHLVSPILQSPPTGMTIYDIE
jgi:hypothetical protein